MALDESDGDIPGYRLHDGEHVISAVEMELALKGVTQAMIDQATEALADIDTAFRRRQWWLRVRRDWRLRYRRPPS